MLEAYRIKAGDRVQFEGAIIEVEAVRPYLPTSVGVFDSRGVGFIVDADTLVIKL